MSERNGTPRTAYIRFFAEVDKASVGRLIATVERKLKDGARRIVVIISSPGGKVYAGLSAYNFLKGIPAEVITHNFGNTDSIATVIYCAGEQRYCVPHARFLLHGIGFEARGIRFDERLLDERMKGLRADRENLSRIIAEACRKPVEQIEQDVLQGTVLTAPQAVEYGLVHEVRAELFEPGADVVAV